MPHAREVRATSHDRHDQMLVAALAADDLAGADRDQALDLTRSCTECSVLHDDLRALARATASAPPPIAFGRRDFQLSPADAARLRPVGWRRLAGALSGARAGLSRPLGVGLATIGLAGLLIGNVQLQLGSSAASAPAPAAAGGAARQDFPAASAGAMITTNEAPSAAPQGAEADGSAAPMTSGDSALSPVTSPTADRAYGAGGALVPAPSVDTESATRTNNGLLSSTDVVNDQAFRPLNLLFGAAIVLGLGLLLLSLRKDRASR
jgi:hypothetical protein